MTTALLDALAMKARVRRDRLPNVLVRPYWARLTDADRRRYEEITRAWA